MRRDGRIKSFTAPRRTGLRGVSLRRPHPYGVGFNAEIVPDNLERRSIAVSGVRSGRQLGSLLRARLAGDAPKKQAYERRGCFHEKKEKTERCDKRINGITNTARPTAPNHRARYLSPLTPVKAF